MTLEKKTQKTTKWQEKRTFKRHVFYGNGYKDEYENYYNNDDETIRRTKTTVTIKTATKNDGVEDEVQWRSRKR